MAHGARNIASWLASNSSTTYVPPTDAIGQADAEDPGHLAALGDRHLVREHGHHRGEQAVEEQLGEAPAGQHDRDVRCDRDESTPSVPPTRPIAIHGRRMPRREVVRSLILPSSGLPNIATRAPTPVTSAQAPRRLVDPDQRVDLQRQRDQQRRDEHQAGAHEREGVRARRSLSRPGPPLVALVSLTPPPLMRSPVPSSNLESSHHALAAAARHPPHGARDEALRPAPAPGPGAAVAADRAPGPAAPRSKLVLVSAPAGFGKTTLLTEWLAAMPEDGTPTLGGVAVPGRG